MSKINIERPECYMDLYDEYREAMEERLPWDAGFKKPTTPASLRGKIRRFLETYNVTSTSFQRVIGVNPGSFNTFMTGKYKDPWAACGNCTYDSAEYFFHFEKKSAGANVVVGAGAGLVAGAGGPGAGASAAAPLAAAAPKLRLPDVTSVVLDDEENVFLTPKEVRAEISELKRRYKFSNGDFAVACGVAKGAQPGAPIGRFLAATGDFGGEQMDVYRPAAQFIEKMRVFEERPKSKKRKDLEADSEGRPGKKVFLGLNPSTKYLVMAGTYMTKDSLGRNVHGHPGW